MAIAYEFDDRVVVIHLEGEYANADLENAVVGATTDPACPQDPLLLLDARRSRSFPSRTAEEVRAAARVMAARAAWFGGRLGMVADGDAALARLRLARAVMREDGVTAEPFTDLATARAWLLADAPLAPAPLSAADAFAHAQRRAATSRQGSARCVAAAAGAWWVVSEQPAGADRWQLVVDAAGGEHHVAAYPDQWMLLEERALLDLVGAPPPAEADTPRTADAGAFAMRLDGFEASVTYDEAAELFRGEVINARTPVHFTGGTAGELRAAFRAAIDDYRAARSERPE